MLFKTMLFAASCACIVVTVVACDGVDEEPLHENDAIRADLMDAEEDDQVAWAPGEDDVEGAARPDGPQEIADPQQTDAGLNACCFKCIGSGSKEYVVFGGQTCQQVANNRCQSWWLGTGYQAHQCVWPW